MKHIVFRTVFFLVLIAALAGIAFIAYNAGVARVAATNSASPAIRNDNPSYPFYGWWPFPFFGFGCFLPLALIFLFFLVFGAARAIIWGPRTGWHSRRYRYTPWKDRGWGDDIPTAIVEMHRRMHAADEEKPTDKVEEK